MCGRKSHLKRLPVARPEDVLCWEPGGGQPRYRAICVDQISSLTCILRESVRPWDRDGGGKDQPLNSLGEALSGHCPMKMCLEKGAELIMGGEVT